MDDVEYYDDVLMMQWTHDFWQWAEQWRAWNWTWQTTLSGSCTRFLSI